MSTEYLNKNLAGAVIRDNVMGLDEPGPPVYIPRLPEQLGLERTDTKYKKHQMLESILTQAKRLAPETVIDVNDEYEIVIANTVAASAHTVITVPYDRFEETFRRIGRKSGYEISDDVLIAGNGSDEDHTVPPTHAPLDMLTWIMRRQKGTGLLLPVDFGDLRSGNTGNPDIDQYLLHLSNDQLNEVFEEVIRRGNMNNDTIMELYTEVVRAELPFLPEKTVEDLLNGVLFGYYRGDDIKMLAQFNFDHRGKGPMSNFTAHFRNAFHVDIETLIQIIKERNLAEPNKPISYKDLNILIAEFKEHPDVFGNDIIFAHTHPVADNYKKEGEVLKEMLETYNVTDLLKGIDPLSSVTHRTLKNWVSDQLSKQFSGLPVAGIVPFEHHTPNHQLQFRVSEGHQVILDTAAYTDEERQKVTAEALTRITTFIGDILYPLWDDVNNYVIDKTHLSREDRELRIAQIGKQYGFGDQELKIIQMIEPTERQLELSHDSVERTEPQKQKIQRKLDKYQRSKQDVQAMKKMLRQKISHEDGSLDDLIELIYFELYGQKYDDENMNIGLGIPGTPSGCITYHTDKEGNTYINFGWLLSTKGLSEQWLGAIMKRLERKG
ncbi:hypothetical protein BH09PAT2_BH09PAT2_00550 [soil metagenome]